MVFTPYPGLIMDVKKPDPRCFTKIEADEVILPAHSYMLARTVETFRIPDDIIVICLGKSSYARAGFMINVTPLEPGWYGEVTLEIANLTPVPSRVYANEGIAQFIFLRGETKCNHTYATKNGGVASKYQDQKGVVVSRS
jgi:dCTP deaminase